MLKTFSPAKLLQTWSQLLNPPTSVFHGQTIHCGSHSQVPDKQAGTHLIQTNLFWLHLAKERAASIH